jgi:predicted transcriptional regulator
MKVIAPAAKRATMVLTAEVVAAYVRNHVVKHGGLSDLISQVHSALARRPTKTPLAQPVSSAIRKKKPAVPIRQSVTEEQITCLECGDRFKSLKRHLLAGHALTPEEYRARWRLTNQYPMVAPTYTKARSMLAKELGLGLHRGRDRSKDARFAVAAPASSCDGCS